MTVTPPFPRPKPSLEPSTPGTVEAWDWELEVTGPDVLELGREVVVEAGSVGWLGGLGVLLEGTDVEESLTCACC